MKSNDVASLTIAVVVAWSLTYPAWPASTQKELERVRDLAEGWFSLSQEERDRLRAEIGP